MTTDADAERRRSLILVLAACKTAIDRLDPDDVDQLGLITGLDELCDLVASDLERERASYGR